MHTARLGFEFGSFLRGMKYLGVLLPDRGRWPLRFCSGNSMKDVGGRREAVYPVFAIHQMEEFGEHWCTLRSLSGTDDDEL